MSHRRLSHVTRVMSHMYEWVMSHRWMSHVKQMNESCHTDEWVISHIGKRDSQVVRSHIWKVGLTCHTFGMWVSHETPNPWFTIQWNTLQHTATHCNTLQHTATHLRVPHASVTWDSQHMTHSTLQHTATHFTCTAELDTKWHTPTHTHLYMYIYVHTYICIYIYIYICICIYWQSHSKQGTSCHTFGKWVPTCHVTHLECESQRVMSHIWNMRLTPHDSQPVVMSCIWDVSPMSHIWERE